MKTISKEEFDRKVASGEAKQVHLYNFDNVLHPRGSMEKESLGAYILERLKDAYESWTDPQYADSHPHDAVLKMLYNNLMNESVTAYEEFYAWTIEKLSKP